MTRRQFSAIISALPLCGTALAATQRKEAPRKAAVPKDELRLYLEIETMSLLAMNGSFYPGQSFDNRSVGYFNGIPTYILRPAKPSSWKEGGWQFAMERREYGKVKHRTDADVANDLTPKTIWDQAKSTTHYLKDRIQLFQIDNA